MIKVAIINSTARYGSTGKIAYGQYTNLKKSGYTVKLFYGRTCEKDINDKNIICLDSRFEVIMHVAMSRLSGLHSYYSNRATKKLIKMLEDYRPDLVQLYNLHNYYINADKLLRYLKDKDIPTVYSMLDEYPYLGRNCYYFGDEKLSREVIIRDNNKDQYPKSIFFLWNKKYYYDKAFCYDRKNIIFTAPEYCINRAIDSGLIQSENLVVVDEYVDTDNTFYPRKKYEFISQELIESEKIIVLTVAPFSNPRKGGKYFLELAERMQNNTEYQFVYVGMDRDNVDIPANCKVIPFVGNQNELAEYYSVADVFVCTSLADTMPNVCLDSLACGTPVIGFDNTGVSYVANEPLGVFVENRNVQSLKESLPKEKKTFELIKMCREYAVRRYSLHTYFKNMMSVYNKLLMQ